MFLKNSDRKALDAIKVGGTVGYRAENQLFEKYSYFIRAGQRKYGISEDDSFNAYSDTILSVLVQIKKEQFESRSSIKTFLYQIFINKCVDISRKNTTKKASVHQGVDIESFAFTLAADTKNSLQQLIDQYDITKLYRKLSDIGEKCHQILLLWGEGQTDKHIAEQLAYNSAAVVKTTRGRCLEKLRLEYFA